MADTPNKVNNESSCIVKGASKYHQSEGVNRPVITPTQMLHV